MIVVASLLILFLNFALFLWTIRFVEETPWQSDALMLAEKRTTDEIRPWPPLYNEKVVLKKIGYDISWTEGQMWGSARKVLGEYSQFFELILLRVWVLLINSPIIFLAMTIGVSEGLVRQKLKAVFFQNISSTRYHIFFRLIVFIIVSVFFFYISFPFGTVLPGNINLLGFDLWLGNPLLWTSFLAMIGAVCVYNIVSSFNVNI